MKIWLAFALALAVSSCSQGGGGEASEETQDSFEAPGIAPTAAPGVAFRYSYLFELRDEAISGVQEKQAARCEALGVNRCRITGLDYRVDEREAVRASLTVKLAPEIARQFGKEATADVSAADGRLRRTEFSGEDTEPATTQAGRQQSDLRSRIAEIERQLAGTRNDRERTELQAQLSELRRQVSQAQATITQARDMLASTPMTFNYYGRGGIEGFRTNPVEDAFRLFVASLVTMVTVVLKMIAMLLPWLLLIGLLVAVVRSRVGRAAWRLIAPSREKVDE